MLEKQYSVQFFTSLVESMQKVCREYLQFEQAVELSGYLSLEIDNTKRERYVVSELLHNTGNVISESYCTKAFKTVPHHAKNHDSDRDVLRELNNRQRDQSHVLTVGADSGGCSKQFVDRSAAGFSSFVNENPVRKNNSFPRTDISQQEEISYTTDDWQSTCVQYQSGSVETGSATCVFPGSPSVNGSCNRMELTSGKRRTAHTASTSEPKKGKPSSSRELSERLSSSSVLSNIQQSSDQSVSPYSTTSDSQSSVTNTCNINSQSSVTNTCNIGSQSLLPNPYNIKTEDDSSLQFVQIDEAEDSSGLLDGRLGSDRFRSMSENDQKSDEALHSIQGNHSLWQEGDEPNRQVELFKNQLQCTTCGMKCLSEAGLLFHKCRHKPRDTVKCPLCSKTFYNRQSMKRHQAVHSPLKPYSCEVCGAKFSSKTAMTQHLKYRHQNTQVMTMSWDIDDNHMVSSLETKQGQAT
ncbi:zinc finger and SCAN domain-containing protein 12-like isoform X2 [Gigantopelta aegis]|uniref:zinc finger and SCAN domain-containing protein 12-like isoform X2 n=1 Tax=Gigantopelta aegis TaxID=1735272 RepID=UPI001B88921F|nr:zinc finger and SCAN domain-containing protein 12-like isoform X2 [Gigantopelta aegis]